MYNHAYHALKSLQELTFDLSSVVCDVAWAPFASTVFAARTADGKVSEQYVYTHLLRVLSGYR